MRSWIAAGIAAQTSPAPTATTAPSSTPTPEAPPQPKPFAIGTTTYQGVIDRLGKPKSTSAHGDGTKIVVYMSNKTRVKGTSFIPVVGLFAGGAKSRLVIRTFTFGPDGVLQNYSTTDSTADCSVGLFGASCK